MDFRCALYLGLRHRAGPGDGWPAWRALTLGKPAALQDPPGARELARELAQLQGCEAATVLPSTLHLYRDLFCMLAAACRYALLVDGAAYPIARWGVECAASRGMPVTSFRHGDSAALARLALALARRGWAPVVLADGYTPGDARPPPLRAYAEIAANLGGWLVLDDTQALGILGPGGGGSVRLHGLRGAPVLAGASLAKAFGAPLAVLAGPARAIQRFEQCSETRVHTSPPSVAVIAAARQALRVNARHGAVLRRMLAARIRQLRRALAALGLACHGGAFPVQVVPLPERVRGEPRLADALAERLQALLLQTRDGPALGLLLRADHGEHEVARAVELLANAIGGGA